MSCLKTRKYNLAYAWLILFKIYIFLLRIRPPGMKRHYRTCFTFSCCILFFINKVWDFSLFSGCFFFSPLAQFSDSSSSLLLPATFQLKPPRSLVTGVNGDDRSFPYIEHGYFTEKIYLEYTSCMILDSLFLVSHRNNMLSYYSISLLFLDNGTSNNKQWIIPWYENISFQN